MQFLSRRFSFCSLILLLTVLDVDHVHCSNASTDEHKSGHYFTAIAFGICIRGFDSGREGFLHLRKGDTVAISEKGRHAWYGAVGTRQGLFPRDRVRELHWHKFRSQLTLDMAEFESSAVPKWDLNDPVEVYCLKGVLGKYVFPNLNKSWILYHVSLGFLNNATGEKIMFEMIPRQIEDAFDMVFPKLYIDPWRPLWHLPELPVRFYRPIYIKFWNNWDAHKFTNFSRWTRVAKTSGATLSRFVDWLDGVSRYVHTEYSGTGILVKGIGYIPSQTCADFQDDALQFLHKDGVHLNYDKGFSRDFNLIYARSVLSTKDLGKHAHRGRQLMRSVRYTFTLFPPPMPSDYTLEDMRDRVMLYMKAGVHMFVRTHNDTFLVAPSAPFLNHCRDVARYPWESYDPSAIRHCALPLEADQAKNPRIPWPWGVIISTEAQLDRSEVFSAFVLLGVVSSLPTLLTGFAQHRSHRTL